MSGQETPKSKHLETDRELVSPEVDKVPASTTPTHAFLHTPSAGAGSACIGGGQQAHDGGMIRREVSESKSQEKFSSVNAQNLATSDEKYTERSSKSQDVGKEGIKVEDAAATQQKLSNPGITRLSPAVSENDGKSKNLDIDSSSMDITERKAGEPMMHISSFRVTEPNRHEELQPDSSSESHPLTSHTPSTQANTTLDLATCKPRSKVKRQKGLGGAKDGKDSDSSVSSKKRSSKSKTKIKSKFAPGSLEYIEERLCGRIFSGWVEERRWVESVGGYRDVIEVDEWEVEMNHQLQAIISSIAGVQEGSKWINITPPHDAPYYCLWVLQEAPPTPGHYWYTITGVKLQPQFGLMITVKEIRSIHPHDGELAAARRTRFKKASQGSSRNELESMSDMFQDWAHQLSSLRPATVLSVIASTLTLSNIKETIRFLIVLVMTLVIGLVTFMKESQALGLRFIREAGIFFHNATPFLQTFLGFIEKIVGGLYLLVAMVYRDWRRPSAPPPRFPPPSPSLTPSPQPRPSTGPRAIQYVSPERWVVKTQNNDFT